MQSVLAIGSLFTTLVVGGLAWRGRGRGWANSLASALVTSAVLWMLVFFGTLPAMYSGREVVMQLFAGSMLFALASAIGAVVVGLFSFRKQPDPPEGPGLSPGQE